LSGLQNSCSIDDKPPLCSSPAALSFRRWLIVLTYGLIVVVSVFQVTEFYDVKENVIAFYSHSFPFKDLSTADASYWLSLVNMACYLAFVFPAMFLLHVKGVWFSCTLGLFLIVFGSWLKTSSVQPDLFMVLATGHVLCAIAQPFIQSPLVKLTSGWFGQNEVATATSVNFIDENTLMLSTVTLNSSESDHGKKKIEMRLFSLMRFDNDIDSSDSAS